MVGTNVEDRPTSRPEYVREAGPIGPLSTRSLRESDGVKQFERLATPNEHLHLSGTC